MVPRLFEINDQPWFPQFLREKVQDNLYTAWTFRVPLLQAQSPAQLVSSILFRVLGDSTTSYTFVDFAAGAGGPTPVIESELNRQLKAQSREPVRFVLTDLHPHVKAWKAAAKKSHYLDYVAEPVDAARAPESLHTQTQTQQQQAGKKLFRIFNLAFHHFDDRLASQIVKDTLRTSDGFGIFELQDRTPTSFFMCFLVGLLFFFITPIFFWRSPLHLIFTYLLPIIPGVLVFDGYISSMRTRSIREIAQMLQQYPEEAKGWTVLSGKEMHTLGIGYLTWFICVKEQGGVVDERSL
ncbi:MAG: hypothetical protein Q9160_007385 [Pyrenula sp. 1 TL-2023]